MAAGAWDSSRNLHGARSECPSSISWVPSLPVVFLSMEHTKLEGLLSSYVTQAAKSVSWLVGELALENSAETFPSRCPGPRFPQG